MFKNMILVMIWLWSHPSHAGEQMETQKTWRFGKRTKLIDGFCPTHLSSWIISPRDKDTQIQIQIFQPQGSMGRLYIYPHEMADFCGKLVPWESGEVPCEFWHRQPVEWSNRDPQQTLSKGMSLKLHGIFRWTWVHLLLGGDRRC